MAFHVGRAKQIIVDRGKEASRKPLARALFASYFRMDVAMSVIMGNPVFLDESWWKNDPMHDHVITPNTPVVVAIDSALCKVTVIIAKLTLLKQWAAGLRQRDSGRLQNGEVNTEFIQQRESPIRKKMELLQKELDAWFLSLPAWFRHSGPDSPKEFEPFEYAHPSIPVVLSCAYAAELHLWRLAHPYDEHLPSPIQRLAVRLLRTSLAVEEEADLTIIPNFWSAGLFLRNCTHRERLENHIRQRIKNTDSFFWKFCLDGLHHGWSPERNTTPFKSLRGRAQEIVPGVSENLYRAEGVMNLIRWRPEPNNEEQQLYRFQGDTDLFGDYVEDGDEEAGVVQESSGN
jgi:hypothetical protein